jgi:hypothetical protein
MKFIILVSMALSSMSAFGASGDVTNTAEIKYSVEEFLKNYSCEEDGFIDKVRIKGCGSVAVLMQGKCKAKDPSDPKIKVLEFSIKTGCKAKERGWEPSIEDCIKDQDIGTFGGNELGTIQLNQSGAVK